MDYEQWIDILVAWAMGHGTETCGCGECVWGEGGQTAMGTEGRRCQAVARRDLFGMAPQPPLQSKELIYLGVLGGWQHTASDEHTADKPWWQLTKSREAFLKTVIRMNGVVAQRQRWLRERRVRLGMLLALPLEPQNQRWNGTQMQAWLSTHGNQLVFFGNEDKGRHDVCCQGPTCSADGTRTRGASTVAGL